MGTLASLSRAVPTAASAPAGRLRAVGAQGVRFVIVGTAMTGAQLAVYSFLQSCIGDQAANLLSWFVITLVTTAAHRRITFRVPGMASERDHLVGLGTGAGSLLASAAALAVLTGLGSSDLVQTAGIAAATGVVGVGRFLVLRWWLGRTEASGALPGGPLLELPSALPDTGRGLTVVPVREGAATGAVSPVATLIPAG